MIASKESLFKAAPRRSGVVDVGDESLEVVEMSVTDRIDFIDYAKESGDELAYAFLASRCCGVLEGSTPEEIKNSLDPIVLVSIGSKIMELSTAGKKP